MKFSVKLKINKQRINSQQKAALFFQVLINTKKTTVPLNLYWSVNYFDFDKGEIIPTSKNDKDFNDYKMIINSKSEEINEIFKYYRLAEKPLDIQTFEAEINNANARTDFITFWKTTIQKRFDDQLIGKQTKKNNGSSLTMLTKFRSSLLFRDINKKLVTDYTNFIRRQTTNKNKPYKINTIAKFLSDFKTYLSFAKEEKIIFEDPFSEISISVVKGSITYLNKDELTKIWDYFHSELIKENHKIVLRHFLFACFTGLRHSDLQVISWREIKRGDELEFEPYKTRQLQKIINVPLCLEAKGLIQSRNGNLFRVYANQKSNVILKEVAANCGIFKNLTTHAARHTFATQFLEEGGKLEVLKELLGHTKIETTMIYVHVTAEQKRKQVGLLDNIFKLKKTIQIIPSHHSNICQFGWMKTKTAP